MKKLFLLFCLLSVGVALPMENSQKKATISGEKAAAKYKDKMYPLHVASQYGDLVAVKYFVDNGVADALAICVCGLWQNRQNLLLKRR